MAVLATDVFLAMHAVDTLCSCDRARYQMRHRISIYRKFVQVVFLTPVGAESLTAEQMRPATEGEQ